MKREELDRLIEKLIDAHKWCEEESDAIVGQELFMQAANTLRDQGVELEEAQRIAKMGVVERCRVVHWQVCHDCPDLDCGDNLTPAKAQRDRLKAALEKIRHIQKDHATPGTKASEISVVVNQALKQEDSSCEVCGGSGYKFVGKVEHIDLRQYTPCPKCKGENDGN